MINMHYFDVEQLDTLMLCTTSFTDFTSEALSRDLDASFSATDLSPHFINGILIKMCTAIHAMGYKDIKNDFGSELGHPLEEWFKILEEMFGNTKIQTVSLTPQFTAKLFKIITLFIHSTPKINAADFNRQLGFNADDWSMIIKYVFRNTILINKNNKEMQRKWLAFSNEVMQQCLNKVKPKDLSETGLEDPFSKYIKHGEISDHFKHFIAQLISDGYIKEAETIHSMLQYCRKIINEEKNGVDANTLSSMIADVFFKGLEIFEACKKHIPKASDMSESETLILYMKHLKYFKPLFSFVLLDPHFSEDFSTKRYINYNRLNPNTVVQIAEDDFFLIGYPNDVIIGTKESVHVEDNKPQKKSLTGVMAEKFYKLKITSEEKSLPARKQSKEGKKNKTQDSKKPDESDTISSPTENPTYVDISGEAQPNLLFRRASQRPVIFLDAKPVKEDTRDEKYCQKTTKK